MAQGEMLTIICYDVSDDGVRARVADTLEAEAVRVQRSVFEAWLTAAQADRLRERLVEMVEDHDSVRLYAVPRDAIDRCHADGGVPVTKQPGTIIV